ncbi:MAG: SLC13 family permease [Rhodospirillales bacterium]|nr:MAG: SLC13 family permease [Rhodospirillales bacterium]
MTGEILFVFGLLAAAIVLFASDRVRLDVVAVMVVLALAISGILSGREAVAGFGEPIVLIIGGLFVVGEGLFRTGVAYAVGQWMMGLAGSDWNKLLVLVMLVVAALSAFVTSTGAVAIFIPIAFALAAKAGHAPSRLLIPIAFASLIGGMLTLIGTPPNIVVTTALSREGLEPFHFFSFTPIGALVLVVGVAYMLLIGQRLLPEDRTGGVPSPADQRTMRDFAEAYGLIGKVHRFRIKRDSPLAGKTIADVRLRTRYGVTVAAIERQSRLVDVVKPALVNTDIEVRDILYVTGDAAAAEAFAESERLEPLPLEERAIRLVQRELGFAEVLLTPESEVAGHSVRHARFRERHGLSVLGVRRKGRAIGPVLADTRLEFGDSLLVAGSWHDIRTLQGQAKEFLVLDVPAEIKEVAPNRRRAPYAILVTLGMLLLLTFEVVDNVTGILLAAVAMVLSRCVSMEEAYKAINWQSLVLIAGMLPMATALEKTGGMELIIDGLVAAVGSYGPMALLAGLFVITSVFSQFVSNTATTVLVAPIAIGAAQTMGVSPHAVLMAVAIAASTAFATPVASPVNTLVLGPGNYRFNDFVKVGVPLQVLALIVAMLAVPVFFPL